MKISGLQVEEFGIWSGLSIERFPDGAYVFYGANEAGKSTLLQFIRTMLYGFTDERSRRFVQHRDADTGVVRIGGRIGGSLSVLAREQQYHVRRHASLTNPTDAVGDVRVTARDGSRHGANRLTTLLSGIDETIFNNVFAVGLEEMQHLGTLDDTQASRFLYSLSTGTDRVSLVDVMRQLQTTRARLIGGDEEESYLAELLRRREACQARIQRLGLQGDQWSQLRSELDRLNDEVTRLESSRETCQRRTRLSELALRVQPCFERHRLLDIELSSLGHVKRIPDDAFERLAAIDQEIAGVKGQHDQQEQQRARLQRDLTNLGGTTAVTRQLTRIEALLDQQTTITGLHDQVQQLTVSMEESEFEIHAEQERLGIKADGRGIVPRFEPQTFSELRVPARQLEHLRELLEHNKRDATTAREEAERVELILAETLGKQPDWFEGKDESDIVKALEQTGEVAAALRRRTQLANRVRELRERLDNLIDRRKRLLLNQLLPWEVIQAIGAVFSVGTFLAIWAFFGEWWGLTEQMRTGLGTMGLIGAGSAALLKVTLQHASQDSLDTCHQKIEDAERDFEKAEDELAKLERKIPSRRSGPVDLRDAETQIVRLESLLPMEGQRRRAHEHAQLAKQQAVEIAEQMRLAQQQWELKLEQLGLSRRLTPGQVRELAGESGNLSHLHRHHEEVVDSRKRAMRDLEVYRERMRAAMTDAGLGGKAGTALDELGYLQLHVNQNHQHRKERDALNEKIHRLQRDQQQTVARMHELQRRRQSILSTANAVDDSDLRQMMNQRQQFDSLSKQTKEARTELKSLLRSELGKELQADLYSNGPEDANKRLRVDQAELSRIDERLKELFERRAQVAEQLRTLNADRQLDMVRMELAVIEAKLDDGLEQWKIISAITALLRNVYKRYEKERQPETLKEASQHLSRMTCGKYTRIWTPLDQDALIVEQKDGSAWTIDQMSRGTREQLFLALRLALVSGYARRGVKMPLVLDDILVNFDEERTKAAAEVLVDFAQEGHQMLVFTCHQHVLDLFEKLGATAQSLPAHGGKSIITPLSFTEPVEEKSTRKKRRSKSRSGKSRTGKERKKLLIGFSEDDPVTVVGDSEHNIHEPLSANTVDTTTDSVNLINAAGVTDSVADQRVNQAASSVDDWVFMPTELPSEEEFSKQQASGYVEQVFDSTAEQSASAIQESARDEPFYFGSNDTDGEMSTRQADRLVPSGAVNHTGSVDTWDDIPSGRDEHPRHSQSWRADSGETAGAPIEWYRNSDSGADGMAEYDSPTSPSDDWANNIAEMAAELDWQPQTRQRASDRIMPISDELLDELPDSPILSEHGPESSMDRGIIPDWKIDTRIDDPNSDPSRLTAASTKSLRTAPVDSPIGAEDDSSDQLTTSDWSELSSLDTDTSRAAKSKVIRRDAGPATKNSPANSLDDAVIDLHPDKIARDISDADFGIRTRYADSITKNPLAPKSSAEPAPKPQATGRSRQQSQTIVQPNNLAHADDDDDTALEEFAESPPIDTMNPAVGSAAAALGLGGLGGLGSALANWMGGESTNDEAISGLSADPVIRPTDTGMVYDAPKRDTTAKRPAQPDQLESTAANDLISSTSGAIMPIVLGGSAAELSQPADSDELAGDFKEEHMSIVDRFITRRTPKAEPTATGPHFVDQAETRVAETAELRDTAPIVEDELDDEYEYVEVEVDEDGNEIAEVATTTGDIEDGVEYEYEYVDEDEDDEKEGEDAEYEYVEVDVDEDGNEIEGTAVTTDEEVDDDEYEYEYVDEDDEEDDVEVATATGDVEDGVEYEYEYVDDDEEEEDDDSITAEADDDEYEYVDEDEDK